MINKFIELCKELGVPVSLEKTKFAAEMVVFLGILLNGRMLTLSIPMDKKELAEQLLREMLEKRNQR